MTDLVTVERREHVLLVGVNRPDKRNAWNREVIAGVTGALSELRDDDHLRAGVVFGHGEHFTAGLDLMDVLPVLAEGEGATILPEGDVDPWDFLGEPCPKPVVVAVHGRCYTLGIELILASPVAIASADTVFAQLEVARGIFPLGGGAPRLATHLGKAGAKWLLTAEEFGAQEAHDAGLVSEVVEPGRQLERAIEVAEQIASNAPLGVQAALAAVRAAERAARDAAAEELRGRSMTVFTSEDAMEGMTAMMERRDPAYRGR